MFINFILFLYVFGLISRDKTCIIDVLSILQEVILNTPYADTPYAVSKISTNILEEIKISNVVPTPSSTSIRRIAQADTPYRPPRQTTI